LVFMSLNLSDDAYDEGRVGNDIAG